MSNVYFLERLVIRFMAKQSKKIMNKLQAQKEAELEEMQQVIEAHKPQHKPWEKIMLVGVICITLFLLSAGWDEFDNLNRGMYSALLVSLLLMYAQRTIDQSKEKIIGYINKAAFVSIAISIALFAFVVFYRYF